MLCNVFKRNLFQIHIIICLYDFDLNITKNLGPGCVFYGSYKEKRELYNQIEFFNLFSRIGSPAWVVICSLKFNIRSLELKIVLLIEACNPREGIANLRERITYLRERIKNVLEQIIDGWERITNSWEYMPITIIRCND